MDPYEILGIPKHATPEEIKKAYRRKAMKWHPDRCKNSPEAKDRFHQAANAYQFLSENYAKGGDEDFAKNSSDYDQYQRSKSEQSKNSTDSANSQGDSEDSFADSVFWEVMLDFAIKLAQRGMRENEISNKLAQKGCPQRLASVIADKAFNIHAHYASDSGKKRKPGWNKSSFKEERLENELQRAFIGPGNFILSPKGTLGYYLMVFNEFRQSENSISPFKIKMNKHLLRILNFSVLFFAVVVVTIEFNPGQFEYQLLSDLTLLQLPPGMLALMFIWTIYRKLWIFTLVFWLLYLASMVFFQSYAPQALNNNLTSILLVAGVCYAPFIYIVLFANYFYYKKARATIGLANRFFEDHQDKITWLTNKAGTSNAAALAFIFIAFTPLVLLVPGNGEWLSSINFKLPGIDIVKDDSATREAKLRLKEAAQFFEIAELHFNSSPPDYIKASMAYSTAADYGSLLAAYKLGYMHYNGKGVKQNDVLALEYFQLARRAPLAYQPHSLKLTTEYLAESYNNLGIMYQGGYGTRKNLKIAFEMFRKGAEFGSNNARLNLRTIQTQGAPVERKQLLNPTYQ